MQEKTKEAQERLDKLKAQEKALIAKYNEQERKARTKRLIESATTIESILDITLTKENATYYSECIRFGLIVQHYLGRELIESDQKKFYEFLKEQEELATCFDISKEKDKKKKG